MNEYQLITATQRACCRVFELGFMLFILVITFKKLACKLQSSIMIYNNRNITDIQFFTDHQFERHDCGDQFNESNNTYNYYNNNNNDHKQWRKKCYICGKEGCCSNKYLDDNQQKLKELWRRNQEFRKDKGKYNAFLSDCEGGIDDDINDINKEANHSQDNEKDSMQYVMAVHLSNKFFMHFLTAHDTFLSKKATLAQHLFLNCYVETVFQNIILDTNVAKVFIAEKSQFKAL